MILVHGPSEEVAAVRWIYRSFVEDGRHEGEIAAALNDRGIMTDLNRPWTRGAVHQVLINEKYAGDNVWNRVSCKLQGARVRNGSDMWIRRNGAFAPIVDRLLYDAAQVIIRERSRRLSDEDMLEALRTLLASRGYLSGLVIDEAEATPSSSAYQSRFGSLLRAYQLIGFSPDRDYRYVEVNRGLRRLHPEVVAEAVAGIRRFGGTARIDPATDLLTVNDEFTVSVVLARCQETPSGTRRWHIRLDTGLAPDITVAVRMSPGNASIRDYYLLPRRGPAPDRLRLGEANDLFLDAFRFDSLDALADLARRVDIMEAA